MIVSTLFFGFWKEFLKEQVYVMDLQIKLFALILLLQAKNYTIPIKRCLNMFVFKTDWYTSVLVKPFA